jgi:ribonuclease HI
MPLPQADADWQPDVIVYADGAVASDGTTAVGYVLTSLDDQLILQESVTLGTEYPSHIAEYIAVLKAVSVANEEGFTNPVIYTDSQGIVDHIFQGSTPRNEIAHTIVDKLLGLLQTDFEKWMLEWLPRGRNNRAHSLANERVSQEPRRHKPIPA